MGERMTQHTSQCYKNGLTQRGLRICPRALSMVLVYVMEIESAE